MIYGSLKSVQYNLRNGSFQVDYLLYTNAYATVQADFEKLQCFRIARSQKRPNKTL